MANANELQLVQEKMTQMEKCPWNKTTNSWKQYLTTYDENVTWPFYRGTSDYNIQPIIGAVCTRENDISDHSNTYISMSPSQ